MSYGNDQVLINKLDKTLEKFLVYLRKKGSYKAYMQENNKNEKKRN